jgi:hypothetical protein
MRRKEHSERRDEFSLHRRTFIAQHAGALGTFALAHLLSEESLAAGTGRETAGAAQDPLAPKPPHHWPKAKAVICLFQHGGPSHMDLFDPKPELTKRHGQPYEGDLEIHFPKEKGNLLASPYEFQKHGGCGMELSNLLPHTGGIADDITLIRSMKTEHVDHGPALRMFHSGKVTPGRPTWPSWALYGLGGIRDDLPAYVVLSDPGGLPVGRTSNWSAGFLPAMYQGTPFRSGPSPVFNLLPPEGVPEAGRRNQLRFLQELNEAHRQAHATNSELQARISNYELAARMQTSVPGILDLSGESEETRRLYGLDQDATREYGTRCLLARRLVEEGVRFVQIFLNVQPWDTHSENAKTLKKLCAMTDQPSAALLTDLKQRGLLESTIVLWTGEFGRLPIAQGTDGRDHNRHGFSLWLAGGGFKSGYVHGATDDFGYRAVEDVVTVPDFHATLLHSLGLDHTRLTYPHGGRDDSLTDEAVTNATVVDGLLA